MDPYKRRPVQSILQGLEVDTLVAMGSGRAEARKLVEAIVGEARKPEVSDEDFLILQRFMQFYVCAYGLRSAMADGELNEAANWIMWSLADEIREDQEQSLNVGRVAEFLHSPMLQVSRQMPEIVTSWLTDFYYYARRRAAMRNIGESLWEIACAWFSILARGQISEPVAALGAMLLGWAAQENKALAAKFTPQIAELASRSDVPIRSRVLLVVTMATRAGRFSATEPYIWAKLALDELDSGLLPHDRLQMLISVLQHEYDAETFQQALETIERIPPRNLPQSPRSIAGLRMLDLMPDLVLALCAGAMQHGDIDGLTAILEKWYRIDVHTGPLRGESTVVFSPFQFDGFRMLQGGRNASIDADPQEALKRVVKAANFFGSTSLALVGEDNSVLPVPDRFGVPDEAYASEFEAALTEAYCPKQLIDEMAGLSSAVVAQLLLGAKAHPIQPVQLRALGKTWPIVASLNRPQDDRAVKNVVLWSGAASMTEHLEVEAVREIFLRRGATVRVFEPEVTTLDEFLRVYQDPLVDLLWVVSHGEYDHWAPKNVAIQIGRSHNFIQLDDLLDKIPTIEGRRLLVLNVCDGGRFEELGVLPRIGFAPALADSNQAVVSQMWPVKGLASAAFGTLLASHLASGAGYFNAFCEALTQVRCTRDELVGKLTVAIGRKAEICDRVRYSSDDFESFALTGSAVFYQ